MRRSLRSLGVALGLPFIVALVSSCVDSRPTAPAAMTAASGRLSHAVLPAVRISEFHYDNSSTDAGEAIEISGPAGTSLVGWQLVRYNGSNGAVYTSPGNPAMPASIPATCGTRGVVVLNYPTDGLQNGAPDGFALIDAGGFVIEFLSYEGTFTAVGGPAIGMLSVSVGVSETGSANGTSIKRDGNGVWTMSAPSSFGACNDFSEPQPEVDHVTIDPTSASLLVGGTRQFTAAAFAATVPVTTGFTWTVTPAGIATVNGNGLVTGIGEGDAVVKAATANGEFATATIHVDEAPLPNLPTTRFSEIHYDNVATDVGEFIEVEGPAGMDLTGWSVVLYNGDGGAAYSTRMLAGSIPASCGPRGVVVLDYEQDGVQNGGPDGFALVDATGAVVEFLSYEGAKTSTNIVVSQSSAAHFQTLQRRPSGVWEGPKASTRGGCNGSTPVTPVNQISFSGRVPFDAPLPVGFEDQLFADLRSPSNATVATTITWTSTTPSIASIDARGVMHALAEGTATFRATAEDGTTAVFSLPMEVATASTTAQYGNHAEFGEPTDADASDDYILRRTEYTSSFNRVKNIPNWVAYNLETTHMASGQDRCDCFTYDPQLPAEFARYTTADYTGAGAVAGHGIDRGHLARSFDRTTGSLDNARTFYFSNIIPQTADNNQGPWASFENYLGNLASAQNKELYIVTGASGSKGTVKNEGLITIPSHVWKVAVIMPRDQGAANVDSHDDVEIIAVILPNEPGIRNVDWNTYRTTVNAVETLSGYDVLALLPDDVEALHETGLFAAQRVVDGFVTAGTMDAGEANSLSAKIAAAAASIEGGNATAARNQLRALLNEVQAMERSRRLSAADAAALRAAVGPLGETE
jgi:DNA/RNA endonuclease G (NUC1)